MVLRLWSRLLEFVKGNRHLLFIYLFLLVVDEVQPILSLLNDCIDLADIESLQPGS